MSAATDDRVTIYTGDCLEQMKRMPSESVNCCVTSPPYYGLRDYGIDGQIGLDQTPDAYVAKMVEVFREVRRVLREDGTLWLNLGDSYVSAGGLHDGRDDNQPGVGAKRVWRDGCGRADGVIDARGQRKRNGLTVHGIAPKNLLGIPWRVAFALQADGWYLRQDIIWAKPNPMPESVRDRCTKAHEYIFLLAKSERYYYDSDAMHEPAAKGAAGSNFNTGKTADHQLGRSSDKERTDGDTRNRRSVWTVATQPYSDAHFATFPPALITPCILAGCPAGGVVLDPFNGAGTTALVSLRHGRRYVGCELNPDYVAMTRRRIQQEIEQPPLGL